MILLVLSRRVRTLNVVDFSGDPGRHYTVRAIRRNVASGSSRCHLSADSLSVMRLLHRHNRNQLRTNQREGTVAIRNKVRSVASVCLVGMQPGIAALACSRDSTEELTGYVILFLLIALVLILWFVLYVLVVEIGSFMYREFVDVLVDE